jgi:hypothetical protein
MTTTIEQIYAEFPALKRWPEDVAKQMYDQMHPKKNLADIQKGDWIQDAEVLVIRVMGTSGYIGCPSCFTKREGVEAGISFPCNNTRCAGAQRVATRLTKWVLLGSDETTKVVLDFPPFGYKLENGEDLVAKVCAIRGRVQDPRQQKERKTGKVLSEMPVIMVKDLRVVSDIRDVGVGSPGTAVSKPVSSPTTSPTPSTPTTPSPPTPVVPAAAKPSVSTEISPDKLNAFSLWMTFRTENGAKPVAESQVKTYVENNLHTAFEAFLPYLEKIHIDSQGIDAYRLKVRAAT